MITANEKLAFVRSLKQINVTSFALRITINGTHAEDWFNLAMAALLRNQIVGENAPALGTLERSFLSSARDDLRAAIAEKKAELDALKAQLDNLFLGNP